MLLGCRFVIDTEPTRRQHPAMKSRMAMMLMAIGLMACQSDSGPALAGEGAAAKAAGGMETLTKKVGETFTVSLKANHTTGFSWGLDGKADATVLRQVSTDYINDTHLPGMVGYGGTERWKFQAMKQGTTVLHFLYRRPWEKDTKPGQECSFRVVVE